STRAFVDWGSFGGAWPRPGREKTRATRTANTHRRIVYMAVLLGPEPEQGGSRTATAEAMIDLGPGPANRLGHPRGLDARGNCLLVLSLLLLLTVTGRSGPIWLQGPGVR